MNIVCLDMEGVLVPEIWIAFSEETGIPELRRTTRDEPDYGKLMRFRLGILKEHGLGLEEIQAVISKIDPLPGAREFLDRLQSETQVIILSDTFEQFARPLMEKLGWPTLFCNTLEVAESGEITGYQMRCEQSKLTTVMSSDSRSAPATQNAHSPISIPSHEVPKSTIAEKHIDNNNTVQNMETLLSERQSSAPSMAASRSPNSSKAGSSGWAALMASVDLNRKPALLA